MEYRENLNCNGQRLKLMVSVKKICRANPCSPIANEGNCQTFGDFD